MNIIRGCRGLVGALALAALVCGGGAFVSEARAQEVHAQVPAGWKVYKGDWFEIGVPPGYVAKPRKDPEGRKDEVSIVNERAGVEFSVYSPLWNGDSVMKDVERRAEILTEKESKKTGKVTETQYSMTAKDKSYIRFVVSRINSEFNTNLTWGIKVPNMDVYKDVRPTYVKWKATLVQFGD